MGYVDLQINKTEIPDFDCIVEKSKHYIKATSVHKLTPHDIDIVAAMGDSLTAGFGACAYTLIDLFVECRGISWSIGGDDDIRKLITLPNILKEYNPNLKGYAVGITPPLVAFSNENLDVAVSGWSCFVCILFIIIIVIIILISFSINGATLQNLILQIGSKIAKISSTKVSFEIISFANISS